MNKTIAFFIGCLGIRLLVAFCAKNLSRKNLKLSSIPAAILGASFIILYLFDLRKTGFEAGGKIWWNILRPVHGMLYLLFAVYAYKQEDNAWLILLLDVIIGFLAWLWHYHR